MSAADEILQQILAETKRRETVWQQMEAAAKEALRVVLEFTRKQGDTDPRLWFNNGHTVTEWDDIHYCYGKQIHRIGLYPNRKIRPLGPPGEPTYKGFPDLKEDEPILFLNAAIERLVGCFNNYREE